MPTKSSLTQRWSQRRLRRSVFAAGFWLAEVTGGVAQLLVVRPFMRQQTPDTLKVDVGPVTSRQELHGLLADAFHFPDYYGENWDAFDECIRDVELPTHIEIIGLEKLRERLPREADLLQRCVAHFVRESGHDITIQTA